MSVDFIMSAVKIGPNNEVPYNEEGLITEKNEFIHFSSILGIFDHIRDKVSKPVNFDWWDKMKNGYEDRIYPVFRKDCHDPTIVFECLEEIYRVIQEHGTELSKDYWLSEEKDKGPYFKSIRVYLDDTLIYIDCSDNDCNAVFMDKQNHIWRNKDLRNETRIMGFRAIENQPGNEPKYIKGGPITIYIDSTLFLKSLKYQIMQLIEVCKYAISNNLMIFTSYS